MLPSSCKIWSRSDKAPLLQVEEPQSYTELSHEPQYLSQVKLICKFTWPEKEDCLRTRLYLCACLFTLERTLYIALPYLYGTLFQAISLSQQSSGTLYLLAGVFLCKYLKDHLTKSIRSLLWLEIAQGSRSKTLSEVLSCVSKKPCSSWAEGKFLSNFNKGASLDVCFQEVLFSILPTIFDCATTTFSICHLIGRTFGLCVGILGLVFIIAAFYNASYIAPQRRVQVQAKRNRDCMAYV